MRPRLASLALLAVAIASCRHAPPELVPVEDGRLLMGTVLDVSLQAESEDRTRLRAALEDAFASVAALDALASRYASDSELTALNAEAGGEARRVHPDLYAMLEEAERARLATRGAFDVRVGPVVDLWIRAARLDRRPAASETEDALRLAGAPIELLSGSRVRLAPGASVDLGGFAKGFALDRIVPALRASGARTALLSFGGSSVWAVGRPWRLRIEDDAGAPLGVIEIEDRALSVSSSLAQSSVIEGVSYGHVVDPRNGEAVRERRRAVVVADRAALAEVLSTALLVLDADDGRAVVEAAGAEAWVRAEDGSSWQTGGWDRATRFQERADPS